MSFLSGYRRLCLITRAYGIIIINSILVCFPLPTEVFHIWQPPSPPQALQSQIADLIGQFEAQSDGGMKQVPSFASSGVQVCT